MSVSSQTVVSGNWKPTDYEITELLLSLEISPPHSFDENFFPTSTNSCRKSTSLELTDPEDPGISSSRVTPTNEDFKRETAIENLVIIKEEGNFMKLRNHCFHEHLVEHFKRKQMMHVFTDESEDDVLLNEYLRKLDELERSNEELRKSREEWDAELERTRENIRMKKKESRDAVDSMISKERAVGTSTWNCGKPLGLKRIQALITRQLDRIKDITKFRLRYTRLRDELISREMELNDIMISSPNLTKEDYERLEAELFYYKRELKNKEIQYESLMKRRSRLIDRTDAIRRRIVKINRDIDNCEETIDALRKYVMMSLEVKRISLIKLTDARKFIHEFHEVIGQCNSPEFLLTIANIRNQHEHWMSKISKTLRDIKILSQSLNAARAKLILHGNDL